MENEVKFLLKKILNNHDLVWLSKSANSKEGRHIKIRRLRKELGLIREERFIKRISLFTYTETSLKVTFKLAYYVCENGDDFSPDTFYWLELLLEDEFKRMGRKKLLEVYLEKGGANAKWLLNHFLSKAKTATALPVLKDNCAEIAVDRIAAFL